MKDIPVVMFTENEKPQEFVDYPRIIARLEKPFQPRDLFRLRNLLDDMGAVRTMRLAIPKRLGQPRQARYVEFDA